MNRSPKREDRHRRDDHRRDRRSRFDDDNDRRHRRYDQDRGRDEERNRRPRDHHRDHKRDDDVRRDRSHHRSEGDRHHRDVGGGGGGGGSERPPRTDDNKPVEEKQKPNFQQSGKLAEDTNTFNGVVVKYNEPEEAKKPKRKWRLYPFKGEESLEFIAIHNQSAYLLGRNRKVADIPIDHPSCSQQHAVIQFRLMEYERDDGSNGKRVRPYLIDLESSNGTYLNNKQIEPKKYFELFEKDVVKFGYSSREYVIMFEEYSETDSEDEEVVEKEKEPSDGNN